MASAHGFGQPRNAQALDVSKVPLAHCLRLSPCRLAKPKARHEALQVHAGGSGDGHSQQAPQWPTIQSTVGQTPLIKLQKLGRGFNGNVILCKLEGHNPTGSVEDRGAFSVIMEAEKQGAIKPGDTLIEATNVTWGVSLAMAASVTGYKMIVILPKIGVQVEYMALIQAYGADIISVDGSVQEAQVMAQDMQAQGVGHMLNPQDNPDNPLAHLRTTGPELWMQSQGLITHLLVPMDSVGAIMGASAYLKLMNPDIQVIGVQPDEGSCIPGLKRWSNEQTPAIFQPWRLDATLDITQQEAEVATRVLAKKEGLVSDMASGGVVAAALRLSVEVQNAVISTIICDRGGLHLSSHVYGAGPCDSPSCGADDFWSAVQLLVVGWSGPHWVLFLGQEHRTSKQPNALPWCSDSVGVEMAVRQTLGTRPTGMRGALLVCHVGSEEDWCQSKQCHHLRVNPHIKLHTLPTLMLVQDTDRGVVAMCRTSGDLSGLLGLLQSVQHRKRAD